MQGTQASYGVCAQFVSKALEDSSSLESRFILGQDIKARARDQQDFQAHCLLSSVAGVG